MASKRAPALSPKAGPKDPQRSRFSMSALERHATVIAFLLVLFASARIIATYTVFNHTSDEPNHIACGMEWIQNGTYTFETQHPPLARVAVALGPYLIGARVRSKPAPDSLDVPIEGLQILSRDHRYDLTLALARLGVLPFFLARVRDGLLVGAALSWTAGSISGTLFFTFTPPVLAHAGLATTDMPLTACLGLLSSPHLFGSKSPPWSTRH